MKNKLHAFGMKALLFFLAGVSAIHTRAATLTVTGTQTINSNITYDKIIVQNGGILTINAGAIVTTNNSMSSPALLIEGGGKVNLVGNAELHPDGNIEVNPNGYFLVSNATIQMQGGKYILLQSQWSAVNPTDYGAYMQVVNSSITNTAGPASNHWLGIAVAGGNGSNNGIIGSNYFKQGTSFPARINIQNSNLFEMSYGVCNWDFTNFNDLNGTVSCGGIIQANSSVFSYNGWAVRFHEYQNKNAGNFNIYDASAIDKCTFVSYLGSGRFAELEGVEGIRFLGCTFTLSGTSLATNKSMISVTDAGIVIDDACSNNATSSSSSCAGTAVHSEFHTMQYAIEISNSAASTHTTVVRNANFVDIRHRAISVSNCLAAVIMNNKIGLNSTSISNNEYVGISLEGCSGYRVENNEVSANASGKTYGIVVNNSDEMANEIYKNKLGITDGSNGYLDYAIQCNGKNYNTITKDIGLRLLCNDMSYNQYNDAFDILTSPKSGNPTGIAKIQGIPTGPSTVAYAKNVFAAKTNPVPGENDIYLVSGSNPTIYYYQNVTGEIPVYHTASPLLNIQPTSQANSCPDNSYYFDAYHSWEAYDEAVGIAASDIGELEACNYEEADFCERSIALNGYAQLNNGMIHSLLYDGTEFYPAMDSMDINDSLYTDHDTRPTKIDSVKLLLSNAEFFSNYKIWLAGINIQEGNFTDAYSALAITDGMTEDESDEFGDLFTIVSILDSASHHPTDSIAIDSISLAWLTGQAESGVNYPHNWARAILNKYAGGRYEPEVYEVPVHKPGRNDDVSIAGKDITSVANGSTAIKLYPNPATGSLHIEAPGYENAIVNIFDVMGRRQYAGSIVTGVAIDISNLSTGSYLVRISTNGKPAIIRSLIKK